jgi:hypothetical protein
VTCQQMGRLKQEMGGEVNQMLLSVRLARNDSAGQAWSNPCALANSSSHSY